MKKINEKSLEDALDEMRLMFQYEHNRFQQIEQKATGFLAINSVLLAIIALVSRTIFLIPTGVCLLYSMYYIFSIYTLRLGQKPHTEYKNWYSYVNTINLKDKFLLNYIKAIEVDEKINDSKTEDMKSVIFSTKMAWLFFAIGLIFSYIYTS